MNVTANPAPIGICSKCGRPVYAHQVSAYLGNPGDGRKYVHANCNSAEQPVVMMPLEEYNRLVNHNKTLNAHCQELLDVIGGMLLEQNIDLMRIGRRMMVKAEYFHVEIKSMPDQVEVKIVDRSTLEQQAPDSGIKPEESK